MTKIGLIGAGNMATTYHHPSLIEQPDVQLVGLSDLVESRGAAAAARLGMREQFTDYREMLDRCSPEAVYILMPPHHLFDITIECLRRGLHAFIEKPPGVSTHQTESMAREAEANHCLTMVGFNRRFDPLLSRALARARERGKVVQVHATFYKNESAVYYNGAIDVLACDGIHAVDTLRYLGGPEVTSVQSLQGRYHSPVPNAWNALVGFANGASGVLQTNWSTGGRFHRFEVHSKGYSAFVEQLTSLEEIEKDRRAKHSAEEVMGADAADPRKLNGFFQQAEHFVKCVQSGLQPCSNFQDAAKTMNLVDRIREGTRLQD